MCKTFTKRCKLCLYAFGEGPCISIPFKWTIKYVYYLVDQENNYCLKKQKKQGGEKEESLRLMLGTLIFTEFPFDEQPRHNFQH